MGIDADDRKVLDELGTMQPGKVPVHLARRGSYLKPELTTLAAVRSADSRYRRGLDLATALCGLVIAAPLLACLSLLVLVFDGRPVLFVQTRLGKDERPFRLIKLRTMVRDAERDTGQVWAGENDPRVTRLGRILRRFRLDELPQLVNVLGGTMSIVGPRPERPEFVTDLKEKIPFYSYRFLDKPGMTGWAQVNFRYGASETDALEKLQYELYYLLKRSPWLDLKILFKTIPTVLFKPGR